MQIFFKCSGNPFLLRMNQAAILTLLLCLAVVSQAQANLPTFGGNNNEEQKVKVSTQWSQSQAMAGDQRVLAIIIETAEKWHINPDPAQTTDPMLIPTTLELVDKVPAVQVGPAQFPKPSIYEVNYTGTPMEIPVYEGRTIVYVPVIVSQDAQAGELAIPLAIRYQACDDRVCMPPQTVHLEPTLTIVADASQVASMKEDKQVLFANFNTAGYSQMMAGAVLGDEAAIAQIVDDSLLESVQFDAFGLYFDINPAGAGFVLVLLVAGLGGFLLNFTPCVLPVIPIKIMSLSQAAGNRQRTLMLGIVMALGVVAFWLALGLVIASVATFTATNQLFQYPMFSLTVGVIIAVMAVGMCGLFTMRLPAFVYSVTPRHDSYTGSFGFGIMTAILSTPCTAPFMGSAAAWAATTSPTRTLITFAVIGAGMALPYLVLSANPKLVDKMPRTGPASELIKQVMGLLMLAVAAWFVGIGLTSWFADGTQAAGKAYWWAVGILVVVAGGWLIFRTFQITTITSRRAIFSGIGALLILLAAILVPMLSGATDRGGPIDWVYYTPERFEEALEDGNVVVLEFTAEWCLNCKALEHAVLFTRPVIEALHSPGVVPMKIDLTGNNPVGNAKLHEVGRVAIPLLIVFAPDGSEVFKSDMYTVEQVLQAIREAKVTSNKPL